MPLLSGPSVSRPDTAAAPPYFLGLRHAQSERAEALVAAWEVYAAADGLERDRRWWDASWAWMLAQRR